MASRAGMRHPPRRPQMQHRGVATLSVLAVVGVVLCAIHGQPVAAEATAAAPAPAPEQFTFDADVGRLMDIIIHSLYSNRDVFLRELISNAADALDKLRFLAVSTPEVMRDPRSGEELPMHIQIKWDKEARLLQIQDSGIGMTRDELVQNLGTVARSGTSEFLQQASKLAAEGASSDGAIADPSSLIGQFGVGFYSAFLVADLVEVHSVSFKDPSGHNVWQSKAQGAFTVRPFDANRGDEPMTRGTRLILHIKEDAEDYLAEEKIRELIHKYSQFITFPIQIEIEVDEDLDELVEEELEVVDPATSGGKNQEDDDEIETTELHEEPSEDVTPKKRAWVHVNNQPPIWVRDPAEIRVDEYLAFYDSLDAIPGRPMSHIHFKAEGEVDFKSILFISAKRPVDFLYNHADYYSRGIKLFVRRVLIADHFPEPLLPSYLGFIVGMVDSDDLPINVSREMLQESRILDIIRRKITRKALEMLRSFMIKAEREYDEELERVKEASGDGADAGEEEEVVVENRYLTFWKEFGRSLKFGVIDDEPNRNRLAKLLRFRSTGCDLDKDDEFISLDQYIERMKPGQNHIYYHTGENEQQVLSSPFMEKLVSNGYEVLVMTDPVDDNMLGSQLREYDGFQFMSASKENLKLGDEDEAAEKERIKDANIAFKPLKKFIREHMSERVSKVKLSTRLTSTPCVLSSSQYGFSAHTELIMRAQAFTTDDDMYAIPRDKIMELNPFHPLTLRLLDLVNANAPEALDLLDYLYDAAAVGSGYFISETRGFAGRVYDVMASVAKVNLNDEVTADHLAERAARITEEGGAATLDD
ncbi:Endoplasmin-like [Porphyridium purpureum]|uniref:Endoplasmin-like n=1 Tax=Porphyridium purpureum TaxID=35688 RepID=A0A5J4YHT2_PORPP|nr:Endoplasmin-like [Porphyridium purpureum]|eukprot:POR1508..scf297_16